MVELFDAVAILLGVLALLYAAKALLPATVLARVTGKAPVASGCGSNCGGCGSKPVAKR